MSMNLYSATFTDGALDKEGKLNTASVLVAGVNEVEAVAKATDHFAVTNKRLQFMSIALVGANPKNGLRTADTYLH